MITDKEMIEILIKDLDLAQAEIARLESELSQVNLKIVVEPKTATNPSDSECSSDRG